MDKKIKIDFLVKKALDFKNNEQFVESNEIIKNLILNYPDYPKILPLKVVLSGNYYNLKEYEKSIAYSKEILSKSEKSELAALLMYLSYIELNQHQKAFITLFTFLENHPADLLKDTLRELLEGLLNGYGLHYKDKIIYFSEMNNIFVPQAVRNAN